MNFDYIVVGGGTSGCALAARLGQLKDARVLLLEEGPAPKRILPTLPGILASINRYSAVHRTPQIPGLHHRSLLIPQARVLGGGSSINAMICVRAHPAIYDHWHDMGCIGWDYAGVLPYFRRSENFENGSSTYHGSKGPVAVGKLRWVAPFSKAFVAACDDIGIKESMDFNAESPEGAGLFHVFQRRSIRSSATSCLQKNSSGSAVQVKTGVKVTKLLFSQTKATGVEFLENNELKTCGGNQEIIVCCGAIGTPTLLMLSGIGPAKQLTELGIKIVSDIPGVGENLQDHVRLPILFASKTEAPLPAQPLTFPDIVRFASAYARFFLDQNGPMSSQNCEAGAFVKTDSSAKWPNIQFVTHWLDHDLEPCLVAAKSRGRVKLRSNDPSMPPIWEPNFLAEEADVQALIEAVKIARQIANARSFQEYGLVNEIAPGEEFATNIDLERYVRNAADTCFHPAGTCKMGPAGDSLAVVDPCLRVRGIEQLRVADVSIVPRLGPGNTASVALMIGEKAADLIAEESS